MFHFVSVEIVTTLPQHLSSRFPKLHSMGEPDTPSPGLVSSPSTWISENIHLLLLDRYVSVSVLPDLSFIWVLDFQGLRTPAKEKRWSVVLNREELLKEGLPLYILWELLCLFNKQKESSYQRSSAQIWCMNSSRLEHIFWVSGVAPLEMSFFLSWEKA